MSDKNKVQIELSKIQDSKKKKLKISLPKTPTQLEEHKKK